MFVDFTADWCVTCQANKRTSIEISSVRAKLKEINAVALLGDYTREDDAITAELKRFGRAGVPLVLVYPADPKSNPIVLPEVLTPGIVLQALEKAAPESGGEKVGERTGSKPRAAATGVWRLPRMKTPKTKRQTPVKFQITNSKAATSRAELGLGAWDFFGVWF